MTIIGTRNPDGTVEVWPDVDIRGAAYTRPCTTVGLGNGHFVVIPPNYHNPERLAQLAASLTAVIPNEASDET